MWSWLLASTSPPSTAISSKCPTQAIGTKCLTATSTTTSQSVGGRQRWRHFGRGPTGPRISVHRAHSHPSQWRYRVRARSMRGMYRSKLENNRLFNFFKFSSAIEIMRAIRGRDGAAWLSIVAFELPTMISLRSFREGRNVWLVWRPKTVNRAPSDTESAFGMWSKIESELSCLHFSFRSCSASLCSPSHCTVAARRAS